MYTILTLTLTIACPWGLIHQHFCFPQTFSTCSSERDCLSSRNTLQCTQQHLALAKSFGTGEAEASRYLEFVDSMQADAGTVVIPRNFKLLEELEAGANLFVITVCGCIALLCLSLR